jgi:hypothetical protein
VDVHTLEYETKLMHRSNHQFQLALVEKLNDIQEELVRLLPDAEATALSPINTEKFAGEIVNLDAATSY